jgi:outer membrane protein OmpA-like peptidoglycan-associated protein
MKYSQIKSGPILTPSLTLALLFFISITHGQTEFDSPAANMMGPHPDLYVMAPTNTFYGTRGLSQTLSAEPLGEGRLLFGVYGSWYQQQKTFSGVPNRNANIFGGITTASYGVSRNFDVFASLSGYGSTDYNSNSGSGLGSVGGGLQGALPLPEKNPVRMAALVSVQQGLSANSINSNYSDGYNYFETRKGLDFMAKLLETITLGKERSGVKLHVNEGIVTSAESGITPLMLLATGLQYNLFGASLGAELNSRTRFNDISFDSDPLWVTPSIQFRTPYLINLTLGGDIALAGTRNDVAGTRPLEPYRLFGGMAFSFDTQYGRRADAREKERQRLAEKERLNSNIVGLENTLARNTRNDSLARSRQQAHSDSVATAMTAKSHADSLSMFRTARQDSIVNAERARRDSAALAESQRNLNDEKLKRSDAEQQLLSTGNLLMDAVYFKSGKADISINSEPYLKIIAKMLTKYPKLRIEVAGHTDNVGNVNYNMDLSENRAESVKRYMNSVSPKLEGVLSAKGYGMSQPKADNATADGRTQNRRTELVVLNKDALVEYNNFSGIQ